ncbi:MAG: tetratricopeptide repeat protein [Anaerolineae bacterium]|jgi:tetratricopeptide (TPR) repeat protein|nr:tetratricopeptide repeat protein [Anaerolineae bacterium]MBT7075196.1 tetratricopeptide repeat protein [Anaerolineae bacterium]
MSKYQLWNQLGNVYINSGAFEEAIQAYEKSIEANPEFGWSHNNMALAYMRLGQPKVSIPYYQRSIELLSDFTDKAVAWHGMGNSYQVMDDLENAILAFQRAVNLDLNNTNYRHDLAVAKAEYAYEDEEDANDDVPQETDNVEEKPSIAVKTSDEEDNTDQSIYSTWIDKTIEKINDKALDEKAAVFEYETIVFPEGVAPEDAVTKLMLAIEEQSAEVIVTVDEELTEEKPLVKELQAVNEEIEDEAHNENREEVTEENLAPIAAMIAKDAIPSFDAVEDGELDNNLKDLMSEISQELEENINTIEENEEFEDSDKNQLEDFKFPTELLQLENLTEESEKVSEEEHQENSVEKNIEELEDNLDSLETTEELESEEAEDTLEFEPEISLSENLDEEDNVDLEEELQAVSDEIEDEELSMNLDTIEEKEEISPSPEITKEETLFNQIVSDNSKKNGNGDQKSLPMISSAKVWSELGNVFYEEGIFDGAQIAYKKAIELDAQFGLAFNNLALLHIRKGEYQEAVQLYETGIDFLQDSADQAISLNNLGNAHRALKEYESAEEAYRKADVIDDGEALIENFSRYGLLHITPSS